MDRTIILELIFKAVQHVNRFVRETGYDVLSTMISRHLCYTEPEAKEATYINVATQLAKGLSDNWSQVCIYLPIFIALISKVVIFSDESLFLGKFGCFKCSFGLHICSKHVIDILTFENFKFCTNFTS